MSDPNLKDKLSMMYKTVCVAGDASQEDLEKFAADIEEDGSGNKSICGLADALIQINFEFLKNNAGKITVDAICPLSVLDSAGNVLSLTPSVVVHSWALFTAYIVENPNIFKKATKENFWNFISKVYEAIKDHSNDFGKCDPDKIRILPELKLVKDKKDE